MLDRLLRLLALWLLCTTSHAVTVLDDAQHPVEIAKPPQRIVSLLPSLTETVCALGQCQRLVGLDRYSNWPESIRPQRNPSGFWARPLSTSTTFSICCADRM